MPHLHLETTADLPENVDVPDILEILVARLATLESVDPRSIKAYHTLRNTWRVGEGAREGFAHLTLQILSGRPLEVRLKMADAIFETLREGFAASLEAEEVTLSLDVREMDRDTYRKV
jgi:5-carboxymethyl-2-hydroxymuconate isomerase